MSSTATASLPKGSKTIYLNWDVIECMMNVEEIEKKIENQTK